MKFCDWMRFGMLVSSVVMAGTQMACGSATPQTNAALGSMPLRGGRTPQQMQRQRQAKQMRASHPGAKVAAQDQLAVDFPEFATATEFTATASDTQPVFASAEGDVNGDGVPDLVTVNEDGAVNVFLNQAGAFTWSYTDSSSISALNGSKLFELAVADVNGDGNADVVAMSIPTGQFFVWLSKGNGTLAAPVTYAMMPKAGGAPTRGGGLAIADVNGDGHADVVVATASSGAKSTVALQVFPGKGDGTFGTAVESDTTLDDLYYMEFGPSLALADITGDGKLDAVLLLNDAGQTTTTAGLGVMTATGDGAGGFGALSGYSGAFVGAGANDKYYATSNLAVADVNGDGAADVLFADGAGNVYVALNTGSGALGTARTAIATGQDNIFMRVGDLNGDKKTDVVVLGDGFVSAYMGNGDGTFSDAPHSYPAGLGVGHLEPELAAYGGANGSLGVVYVSEELGSATVLLGNGDGTLKGAPTIVPAGETPQDIVVFASGDVNGDGVPDFLAFDYSRANAADNPNQVPQIVSLISDGKGGLKGTRIAVSLSYLVSKNAPFVIAEPMVEDLNGDGKADLLISIGNDLEIAYGNGDGSFQTPKVLSLGSGFAPLDCPPGGASAGKGSDGVLEFVVAYGGDDGCYGSGSQQSGVFAFTQGGAQVNFVPIGSAIADAKLTDLNGDGLLDLVTNDEDGVNLTYAVYATEGAGDAHFDPNQTNVVSSGYAVNAILTGDYNGDGKNDLALLSQGLVDPNGFIYDNTGGVQLLPGNNDGTFGATTLADAGIPIQAGAWGDLNGDGLPDLAVSQFATYAVNPYLNLNVATYNFAVFPNIGGGVFPVGESYDSLSGDAVFLADYNNDGNLDAAIPQYAGGVALYLNARPKPGITLSTTPASLSVAQGGTGIVTLDLAANSAFSGTVTVTCSGMPTASTCTVNPGSVTLAANQTNAVSIVITTTAPSVQSARNSMPAWLPVAGGTQLALAGALLWPNRRKLRRLAAVLLLVMLAGVGALTGCGGGSGKTVATGGTPVGQSTVTVAATAGSVSQTMQFRLTVTAQ